MSTTFTDPIRAKAIRQRLKYTVMCSIYSMACLLERKRGWANEKCREDNEQDSCVF